MPAPENILPSSSTATSRYYSDHFQNRPEIHILLSIIILFFFLVGFFSIYLFHNILHNMANAWILNREARYQVPTHSPVNRIVEQRPEMILIQKDHGLHPVILNSFPVLLCSSSVEKLKDCGNLCSICLSEFSGEETFRLITVCNHAFHTECIDMWFLSHVTCPVCRCNLENTATATTFSPPQFEDVEEEEEAVIVLFDDRHEEEDNGRNEEKL
ncbi:E3 ubiquitin-protein ligase, ATL family [Zostera marina]|uniref:RING-type E3 ubiquitin transferase n=1 Tax=Zostera marina TaxID=29655 RepID=A0A0K9PE00_ZOSMR|nr:E3 ubiquitin-protein ligase, ATL family [Zostera marina]